MTVVMMHWCDINCCVYVADIMLNCFFIFMTHGPDQSPPPPRHKPLGYTSINRFSYTQIWLYVLCSRCKFESSFPKTIITTPSNSAGTPDINYCCCCTPVMCKEQNSLKSACTKHYNSWNYAIYIRNSFFWHFSLSLHTFRMEAQNQRMLLRWTLNWKGTIGRDLWVLLHVVLLWVSLNVLCEERARGEGVRGLVFGGAGSHMY